MKYDLVIPVAPKDTDMLPHCLASLHHLEPQPDDIYIVTPVAESVERILKDVGTKATIILDKDVFDFAGKGVKPSWYQQVIKLFQTFSQETYFVLDADVVLLKDVSLFRGAKMLLGRFKFAGEPNQYYRRFMREAFGLEPVVDYSLVCHHMLFQRSVCCEMLAEFLLRHPGPEGCDGVEWFYNWLVEKGGDYEGNVSEYEAYGHFVLRRHSALYTVQNIKAYEFICYGGWRDVERNMGEYLHSAKKINADLMAIHRRDSSLKREWEAQEERGA